MAIKTVRAQIDGTWHNLVYNSNSGKWEATITAPGITSYTQPGHYYGVTVEAVNDAGTSASATVSELPALKLIVREKNAPVITIVSPGAGAYVKNAQQSISFRITDDVDGSGVDLDTLRLTIDGGAAIAATANGMVCTPIDNGYNCIYTPQTAMTDGSHTIMVSASDHDGNAAAPKSVTYKIDTVPPTLNVTAPIDGLITAAANVTVEGTTNDITSAPVSLTILCNGAAQGAVTVNNNGTFLHTVTLSEGENTISITATDAAGHSTNVMIRVVLDTSVPQITAAAIAPNPVDAGATMLISVVIS